MLALLRYYPIYFLLDVTIAFYTRFARDCVRTFFARAEARNAPVNPINILVALLQIVLQHLTKSTILPHQRKCMSMEQVELWCIIEVRLLPELGGLLDSFVEVREVLICWGSVRHSVSDEDNIKLLE